ncbi:MAG: LPS-assembly protein LptD [Termitinemataceae bacterium]|nr:MAG: LPS-assembly protein LptD [Termitinemataceae bacterium]
MHFTLPILKHKVLFFLLFSLFCVHEFSFAQSAVLDGASTGVNKASVPAGDPLTDAQNTEKSEAASETENSVGGEDAAGSGTDTKVSQPPAVLSDAEKEALKEKEEANKIIDLDIKTSTLQELAQWCRELGLSEGGNKGDLAQRLRSHFQIADESLGAEENQKVITIENARSTEYFTIKAVDEEYARLSGGVELSLNDGDAVHNIKAWEILFNRTRNVLTATGNVEYVKDSNDTRETFKGDSITINLDSWAGSFIDTISERAVTGSETAYKFAGQVISKTDAETTVLKKARVTNAKSDEPYWSLDASKLWILPGSDWGLFSGLLKVGEIPVLWVPVFFLPADEVVFHPVLGTKTREGAFLQTTTYIKGRPDSSAMSENSISKILGNGSGMEQKREGVFLRTTGKKDPGSGGSKIALLFDSYTNLGVYLGTEIALPAKGVFSAWTLSGGLAFTRNVYPPDGIRTVYSPYKPGEFDPLTMSYKGEDEEWNESYLFGMNVPFRYRLKTGFSLSGKYGNLSLDMPMYSDPFIDGDTMKRSESMDLLELLRNGSIPIPDSTRTTQGAYQWTLTGRPNISTQIFAPIISSMSVSSISSVYHFNYKDNPNADPVSPSYTFYFPDKWTIISLSGSLGGTPFSLSSATSLGAKDKEKDDPLKDFGAPRSPWAETENESEQIKNPANSIGSGEYSLSPPVLNQTFDLAQANGLRLSWSYSFSPSMSAELYYSTTDWSAQTDIDLNDIQSISMLTRTDGSTNLTLSEPNNNLFSVTAGINGSFQWQDHVYQNEEAEEYIVNTNLKDTERLNDYRSTIWSTSWTYGTQINPLYWSPAWKTTNLQYNVSGLLARSKLNEDLLDYSKNPLITYPDGSSETTADRTSKLLSDPNWDVIWGEWSKADLSAHRLSANIGVSIFEKMQNITFSTDLPPKETALSANATARIWITETNASTSIKKPFEDDPEFQPVNFTETIIFSSKMNLKQYFTYDPLYEEITNSTTTFVWGNFNFSYNAARSPGYKLGYNMDNTAITGWQTRDTSESKLRPLNMRASYSLNLKETYLWEKRLRYSVSSGISLNLDLQRYTYSKLSFNLTGKLFINNFIDFSMGLTSENDRMFFYLSNLPMFNEYSGEIIKNVPSEDNFFLDLLNSFRFDNESIRKDSGFKLKSFNFSLVHHLGDWNATLSVNMLPWLDPSQVGANRQYKFISNISFIVQWLPITELKTELSYDGKEDIWTSK